MPNGPAHLPSGFRKSLKILAAVTLGGLGCGCVVLPIPHTSQAGLNFRGQIVETPGAMPVREARVLIEGSPRSATLTKANGEFVVSSGKNFHLLYYANPSSSLSFPPGEYREVLLVEKEGYRPLRLDFRDWRLRKELTQHEDVRSRRFDRRITGVTLRLKPISISKVQR